MVLICMKEYIQLMFEKSEMQKIQVAYLTYTISEW
jgi:hypothetical protein